MIFSSLKNLIFPPVPEFSLPEGVRVYAVGDIHGQADLLKHTLKAIEKDAKGFEGSRIIQLFLGDYIDRGMHSRETIDLLLKKPPKGHERICLKGNHEATLLEFLEDPEVIRKWSNFGGFTTLASYGIHIPRTLSGEDLNELYQAFTEAMPEPHIDFLVNLKHSYTLGDYFFVHAGINPFLAAEEQTEKDYLWIRDSFLDCEGFFQHYIVHGHSPVETIDIRANRANLDLSIAKKDSLGCLKIEGNQRVDFTVEL